MIAWLQRVLHQNGHVAVKMTSPGADREDAEALLKEAQRLSVLSVQTAMLLREQIQETRAQIQELQAWRHLIATQQDQIGVTRAIRRKIERDLRQMPPRDKSRGEDLQP